MPAQRLNEARHIRHSKPPGRGFVVKTLLDGMADMAQAGCQIAHVAPSIAGLAVRRADMAVKLERCYHVAVAHCEGRRVFHTNSPFQWVTWRIRFRALSAWGPSFAA